jgi:hypothetical protein
MICATATIFRLGFRSHRGDAASPEIERLAFHTTREYEVTWCRHFKTETQTKKRRAAGIYLRMDCAEHQELEHAYAAAVRRWSQHASPQTTVTPGTDQMQRATALVERNSAANALHLHRHQCLVCKRQGAA